MSCGNARLPAPRVPGCLNNSIMLASLLALGSGASKDERKKRAETRGLAQTGSRTGQLPPERDFSKGFWDACNRSHDRFISKCMKKLRVPSRMPLGLANSVLNFTNGNIENLLRQLHRIRADV